MKAIPITALLLVSLFLFVAGAAADTVQVQNVQINTIGATTPVAITLDRASAGVAGYDINVSLSNPSVASITDVSFPSWAILNESSLLPASSVRLRMVDLYEQVSASDINVPFGTITIQGKKIGSTDVVVTIKEIDSDDGDRLTPAIQSGELIVSAVRSQPIIANHTSTHLSQVPESAINNASKNLHIAYGHTSHGNQIIVGMDGLTTFPNAPYGGSTYTWNDGGTGGALDLDNYIPGASDLGNPDFTTWATATRTYLNANPDVNVIMWSWCGQVGYESTTEEDIDQYLALMNQLETDYPNVNFVYMTGHLDGSGESGLLNQRNEKIRNYVRANNKILFDFADIESFDPDGLTNYMLLNADDGCNYDGGNWATAWQTSHTEGFDWYDCDPDHTQALNGNLKAYAAWWLWARLGGWDGSIDTLKPVTEFSAKPTSGIAPFTVQFTDLSTNFPTEWFWSFSDGDRTNATKQNPVHTFTKAGTYSITLNGTNTAGSNIKFKPYYIKVSPSPQPVTDFSGTPREGTAPFTVQFTDLSTNFPTEWFWSFSDGDRTNATKQNPVHTFTKAGTYSITLNATNTAGSNIKFKPYYIKVSPSPQPVTDFSGTPREGTAPFTVQFTDLSTNFPTEWFWSFSDGDRTNATKQNPVHTFTKAGTYSITLNGTNTAGSNIKFKPYYIKVSPSPQPVTDFSGTPREGTAPFTVQFTDLSTNFPTEWFWSFSDGDRTNATKQNPVHTFTKAGTYSITLNGTNTAGSNIKFKPYYIKVSP